MRRRPSSPERSSPPLGRRRFLRLGAAGGLFLPAAIAGCQSSGDSEPVSVVQVITVGVPVTVTVEVPVEVTVEVEVPVEVEKVVTQIVEKIIAPTPTVVPVTEIDWWLPPLWKGLTGAETDDEAGYGDWPLAMIQQFHDLHPGIRVLPRVTSWTNHREEIASARAGGDSPDLFYEVAGNLRRLGVQGAIQPIDGYIDLENWRDFSQLARDQATMSGAALYYPFLLTSTALLSNLKLFPDREAGDLIPVEGDRTWTFDQFRQAANLVTAAEDDRYAIGWPLAGAVGAYHYHSFFWGHGANLLSEDWRNFELEGDDALAALTFLRDIALFDAIVMPDTAEQTLGSLEDSFLAGNLAVLPASPAAIARVRAALDTGEADPGDFDLLPVAYPSSPGISPQNYTESSGFAIWWQSSRGKMEAAAELGAFLSNTENQRFVTVTNSFPARVSAGDVYTDEIMRFMQAGMKYAAADPLKLPYFAVGAVIAGMMFSLLSGSKNPATALGDALAPGQAAVDAYWDELGF